MDDGLRDTMGRIQEGNNRIASLKLGVKELNMKAQQLRNNASDIQAQDVEGKNCAGKSINIFIFLKIVKLQKSNSHAISPDFGKINFF